MGLLGNYQLGPDAYRERGYAAFAEYGVASKLYLGLSSLITTAQADPVFQLPQVRHAHGLTARWSPVEPLALLAEADFLAWQQPGRLDRLGFAALVQGDVEVMQGLHVMASLEGKHTGAGESRWAPGFRCTRIPRCTAMTDKAEGRLCRDGARGPVSESRLRRLEDGRYQYTPKKGVTFTLTAKGPGAPPGVPGAERRRCT